MPKYAQTTAGGGIVHTIMESQEQPEGVSVIEVQDYDAWYIGSLYDGANFWRLKVEPENEGRATVAQSLNIIIRWIDIQGQTAVHKSVVKVTCGGMVEDVTVTDGIGIMTFEAAEVGEYILVANSPEGCQAVGRVVVE